MRAPCASRPAHAREAAEVVRQPRPGTRSRASAHRVGTRVMADTRAAMLRLSSLVGERTLFENESFRRLWLSKLLSHAPTNAIVYTMLILVVQATGKSFFSSLFVVAYIAPTALLGTVSG